MEILTPDICVIGGGAGGLTVAAGASQMGAFTVLVEKGKMGGDCLNCGCVPSKALLAAAHAAQAAREARRYGVETGDPAVDFGRVKRHVRGAIERLAANDSEERFGALGVRVLRAPARFTGRDEVAADGVRVRARRFVVATGSSPAVPPIPGLADVPYLTNETVFDVAELPAHLVVIGGGAIGTELAQAFRRLGSRVTIVEMLTLLGTEDAELVGLLRARLLAEGVAIHEGARVTEVARAGNGVGLLYRKGEETARVEGSHLLVAAGRLPNVDDLGLAAAGIEFTKEGIRVNGRLRTSNPRVYAIGDATGGPLFTHRANHHAGVVLRNALFRLPTRANERVIPRVVYTSPELASVGETEEAAREAHGEIRVLRWPFAENDRAQTDLKTNGLVKVVTTKRGRVRGAFLFGPGAGDLIHPWLLAVSGRLRIGTLANLVVPYPTLGEVNKRVAGSFFAPALFGDRTRRIVRLLARLG